MSCKCRKQEAEVRPEDPDGFYFPISPEILSRCGVTPIYNSRGVFTGGELGRFKFKPTSGITLLEVKGAVRLSVAEEIQSGLVGGTHIMSVTYWKNDGYIYYVDRNGKFLWPLAEKEKYEAELEKLAEGRTTRGRARIMNRFRFVESPQTEGTAYFLNGFLIKSEAALKHLVEVLKKHKMV